MTIIRTLVKGLTLLLLASAGVRAELPFEITGSLLLLYNSGSTDYTINALTWDISDDLLDTSLVGIRSKLEFPLDNFLGGFDLQWDIQNERRKGWTINLSAFFGLTDPGRKMEDHDWFVDPNSGAEEKFSWTESESKLNYLLVKLEAAKTVAVSERYSLALLVGFHINRVQLDMIGFDGWQHDESNRVSGVEPALYYRAVYALPLAGVRGMASSSRSFGVEVQAAAGRLMASDLDDHLLRGKTAEASTAGWAFLGHVEGELKLPGGGSRQPSIVGTVELVWQRATGSQSQHWYRDESYIDPNSGEEVILVPRGTTISGLDYETTGRQVRFGLGVRLDF